MHTLSDLVSSLQSLRSASWLRARSVPVPVRRAVPRCGMAAPVLAGDAVEDLEPAPQGCGWFDSSHALQCGLHITEYTGADTLAHTLPLDAWLQLHLHPHLAGRVPAGAVRAD